MVAEKEQLLAEGKTKKVFRVDDRLVRFVSKDKLSANNAQYQNEVVGKSAIATETAALVFGILNNAGIATHFVRTEKKSIDGQEEETLVVKSCQMIPIEFIARRIATGSFLRRFPGVKEGHRFTPAKIEYTFKDDEKGDPEWCYEQIVDRKFTCNGVVIGSVELDIMTKTTQMVFEILERIWATMGCALVDFKIEFGVDVDGNLLLADVVDNDSWRLWPNSDKRLQLDKQVYRDQASLTNGAVTGEQLKDVLQKYRIVLDKLRSYTLHSRGMVVIFMGSPSDRDECNKIKDHLQQLVGKDLRCDMHVQSAHKGTKETLRCLAVYEALAVHTPTAIIAVAGRSNGLGPVLASNTCIPVINCPPVRGDFAQADVWSSLRLPSGVGCTTVLGVDNAANAAASILANSCSVVYGRLRARQLNRWIGLMRSEQDLQQMAKSA